jgi:hypothetical protein
MVELLLRHATALVLTTPTVLGKSSLPAGDLANIVSRSRSRRDAGPLVVEPEPDAALDAALRLAADLGTDVVATGSLFLVGTLRRRWYPDAAVVLERTPWPANARAAEAARPPTPARTRPHAPAPRARRPSRRRS